MFQCQVFVWKFNIDQQCTLPPHVAQVTLIICKFKEIPFIWLDVDLITNVLQVKLLSQTIFVSNKLHVHTCISISQKTFSYILLLHSCTYMSIYCFCCIRSVFVGKHVKQCVRWRCLFTAFQNYHSTSHPLLFLVV